MSRVPVCASCLSIPKPLQTDYFCRSCQTPFIETYPLDEQGLCQACRQGDVNFDLTYSYGSYEGTLRELIHLLKYGGIESLAKPLSRLLLQALPLDRQVDVVLAMPMYWRKRLRRGFNQAELLARPVAKRYGLKLSRNLVKSRNTLAQAELSDEKRRKNLVNSFRVCREEEIRGKRILLIDDVMTTGATLREAAATLKAAGAAHVTALTLARVDHKNALTNLASFVQAWPESQPVETGANQSS